MRDNKGFSLIELVVVVALMALLVGVLGYSFSLVTGQEARQCANNLSTALDRAKNYALTKSGSSDAYMELTRDTDGSFLVTYYVPAKAWTNNAQSGTADYVAIDSQTIGKKAVEITCNLTTIGSVTLTSGTSIRFYYDRISGALKKVVWVTGGSQQEDHCQQITVSRGKTYLLTLIEATGRHSLERVN